MPAFGQDEIEAVLARFRGEVVQVPPLFSAFKARWQAAVRVGAPRLKRRRSSNDCRQKRRSITIFELLLQELRESELDLSVRCSKGTYIRTLVEDIGAALGTGAYVSRLHRTACGPLSPRKCTALRSLNGSPLRASSARRTAATTTACRARLAASALESG